MRQCSARPMRLANSIARALTTGSEPGSPRHTGHTWLLGSAPKVVGQAQNIFVAVASSTWVSMPMTVSKCRVSRSSKVAVTLSDTQLTLVEHGDQLDRPVGQVQVPLERPGGTQHQRLAEHRRDDLQPDRQPLDQPDRQ